MTDAGEFHRLSDFLSEEEIETVSKAESQESGKKAWAMFQKIITDMDEAGSPSARILAIGSAGQVAAAYHGLAMAFVAAHIESMSTEEIWEGAVKISKGVFDQSLPFFKLALGHMRFGGGPEGLRKAAKALSEQLNIES